MERAEFDHHDDDYERSPRKDREPRPRPKFEETRRNPWEISPEHKDGYIVGHAGTPVNSENNSCFYCGCSVDEHIARVVMQGALRTIVQNNKLASKKLPPPAKPRSA